MTEVTSLDRPRKRRLFTVVLLYVVSLMTGVLDGLLTSLPADRGQPDAVLRIELLSGILFSLGFLWFCTADAWLLGRPLIEMARLGIFIGWPVGVPIYLVWARGIRGLGLLLLHGIGLLSAVVGPMAVMIYLRCNG